MKRIIGSDAIRSDRNTSLFALIFAGKKKKKISILQNKQPTEGGEGVNLISGAEV